MTQEGTHRSLNESSGEAYAPSEMQRETTQLMVAVKGGDAGAFDLLVQRLRGQAFRVAHALVGSREDALDLSQEAFLKVFRARETFREGEPFLPWFHRILRNTCFSFLRRKKGLKSGSLQIGGGEEGEEWDLVDEQVAAPSARLERSEHATMFWAAFARLGEKDREIVALRHFKELSYKEIAEVLDVPQGTVMSRLFHARKRLRELLGDVLDGVESDELALSLEGGPQGSWSGIE